MITKRHLNKHLDRLFPPGTSKEGRTADPVWLQFHEYLVKYYKRLDQKARALADQLFDQFDARLKGRLDALPPGRKKGVLNRKLAMVRGERSPLPVLYLDTPVIESLIRHGLGQSLPPGAEENVEALYEAILGLVDKGRLACPEDTFHREVLQMGGPQARDALEVIRRYSKGLSFKHTQSIEDFQVFRAIRKIIRENGGVHYREFWKDAFPKRTVQAMMRKHSSVAFKNGLAITGNHEKESEKGKRPLSIRLRIRDHVSGSKGERHLQKNATRHLRELVRLGMKYRARLERSPDGNLDGFWARQKTDLSLVLWNRYGGKPEGLEGLVSLFDSQHFQNIPAIRIKRDIWQALSHHGSGELKRTTAPSDIGVLSAVLPYTDMVILGPTMRDVVGNRLGLDTAFDTRIFGMDEHDGIMAALEELPCAD